MNEWLVDVNHSVEKSPKEDISGESTKQSIRQYLSSRSEVFVPLIASFQQNH